MAGTHEGRVIIFPQLTEQLTPFEDKPQAKKLIDADGGNLILMELAAGQSWHEHHSVHPVVVQALKGKIDFRVKGQSVILADLLHSLTALEDSTLMVTMLTGESHPDAKPTVEFDEI